MAEGESDESLAQKQRLKAALHYSIGKAYEEIGTETGITINREVIAAVNEMVFQQCNTIAKDIELFAKHAKRTTVNVDDVLLVCRRNESLLRVMREESSKIKIAKEESGPSTAGEKKKGGTKKKKELMIIDDDDDD